MKLKHSTSLSLFCAIVASLGGFLFGYNTSVVAGALLFMAKEFSLSIFNQEVLVSIILIGALFGTLFGGNISDRIGRKPTLFITTILFLIGALLISFSSYLSLIFLGRFISGLAIGIISVCVPLYIAEIAAPKVRGTLVSFNQLAITIGILVAFIINYVFAENEAWRWMFGFQFIFLTLFFILLFFLPETPSYLASKGKTEEAATLRRKLGHSSELEEGVITPFITEKSKISHLFKKSLLPAVFIGMGLSIFQQITGINTIIYYAPRIFEEANLVEYESLLATIGIGVINVVMTVVAVYLIDKVGRRSLLLVGLIGMIVCLLTLGTFFFFHSLLIGVISSVLLMGYISFFAISLGPVTWLIVSEIYPLEIRGRAMGLATATNWISNIIVSISFLSLIKTLGGSGTFWLYGIISIIALIFVYYFVPETKGKTFAQIQDSLKK